MSTFLKVSCLSYFHLYIMVILLESTWGQFIRSTGYNVSNFFIPLLLGEEGF